MLPLLIAGLGTCLPHRRRRLPQCDAKDRAALEKQLDAARARLDDAAREVADLTRQLHGDEESDIVKFVQRGGHAAQCSA